MMPYPRLWIRQPVLITPFRHQVEVVVGSVHHVKPTRIARIGVENVSLRVLIKDTEAGGFLLPKLSHRIIVIPLALRHFFWRERNMIVPVEIVAERRHPLEGPPHALLEGFELSQRCSGNSDHCDISLVQVHDYTIEIIGPKRTAFATLRPTRVKHEVID